MRNRAAPTTAIASVVHDPASAEHRGDRVFGKVAEPSPDGNGARGQDIELFDVTARLPKVPSGSRGPAHASRRSRHARATVPAWRSMPLPLMLAGALSAGLGAAVAVWSSAGPDSVPASNPSVSLPELATRAPSPARDTAPGTPRGPGVSTARTTPPASSSTVPSVSGPPSSGAATDSPTATAAPTTASPATPTATSSPSHHRHRSPRPGRGEDGRDENGWDEDRRDENRRGDVARGSTGPGVVDLQRRLQQLQLYLGPADGLFGESVEVALRRYQVARNIPQENGVYGPLTRAVLRAETD
ncbi:peptidoglycan-binding protein [Streptomyces sp. NPDC012825]|uniref:peptidoglycan-binding protein n=1 Tax=Streptomyces sp. NPDC012825 TaxID=3364851 RepID=UPI0036BAA62F